MTVPKQAKVSEGLKGGKDLNFLQRVNINQYPSHPKVVSNSYAREYLHQQIIIPGVGASEAGMLVGGACFFFTCSL